MALAILILFFVFGILGMPIGFILGIISIIGFLMMGESMYLNMLSTRFFSAMNSYVFLALPLFIVAGEIMNKVGLTERIVSFSNLFFGRLRGGLAQVNIFTSIVFGGISGSAVSDTVALGTIFIPAMEKEGYDRDFSSAVTAASSIIAPIIPPSTIMVVYGGMMGISVAGLFAAGIIPGLLIGLALMIIVRLISSKRSYPKHAKKFTLGKAFNETRNACPALLMPIIILGCILGGICTPTEAAALAVAWALLLGFGFYRSLGFRDLYCAVHQCAVYLGIITLILSSASVLSWLLTIEQIPQLVAGLFTKLSSNKYVILILINILLIMVGMIMDIMVSLIILAPILEPLATNLGVHPLHFGVMMCVNLCIALITPPMGGCLFSTMMVGKIDFVTLIKAIWPFIIVQLIVLALIVFVPDITLFIPRLLGLVES